LLCATFHGVPIDVVVEPNTASAMTREAVLLCLLQAEEMYTTWGLQAEMDEWGFTRSGERYAEQLLEHLFRNPPLEWSNLAPFQAVFLRLLAGRLVQTRMKQQPEKSGRRSRRSSYGRPKSMSYEAASAVASTVTNTVTGVASMVRQKTVGDLAHGAASAVASTVTNTVTGAASVVRQKTTGDLPADPQRRERSVCRVSTSDLSLTPTSLGRQKGKSENRTSMAVNWISSVALSLSYSDDDPDGLYVEAEGLDEKVDVELRKRKFHLFISRHNPGVAEVVQEATEAFASEPVRTTEDMADVKSNACCCMLLYLTNRTWTNAENSKKLEAEVRSAMRYGAYVLLVHERPCIDDDLAGALNARHACEFKDFFATTPPALLRANIYGEIAVPLAGGAARPTSLRLLVIAIAKSGNKIGMYKKFSETLGSFSEEMMQMKHKTSSRARTRRRQAEDAGAGVVDYVHRAASQWQKAASRALPMQSRVQRDVPASTMNASDSSASIDGHCTALEVVSVDFEDEQSAVDAHETEHRDREGAGGTLEEGKPPLAFQSMDEVEGQTQSSSTEGN